MLINYNTKWSLMAFENIKAKDLYTLKNGLSHADNKSNGNQMQTMLIGGERQFMICNSCFWCASSYLNIDNIFTKKCPLCQNNRIEILPIFDSY